jgi:hypothetical protein
MLKIGTITSEISNRKYVKWQKNRGYISSGDSNTEIETHQNMQCVRKFNRCVVTDVVLQAAM